MACERVRFILFPQSSQAGSWVSTIDYSDGLPVKLLCASVAIQLAWLFVPWGDWRSLSRSCSGFLFVVLDAVNNIMLGRYACTPLIDIGPNDWVRPIRVPKPSISLSSTSVLIPDFDPSDPVVRFADDFEAQELMSAAILDAASHDTSRSSPKRRSKGAQRPPPFLAPTPKVIPSKPAPSALPPSLSSQCGACVRRFLNPGPSPVVIIDPTPEQEALEAFDADIA